MTKKIKMVCYRCGSDDVIADAYATWNVKEQRWELESTYDKGSYCNSCNDETRIEEEEID